MKQINPVSYRLELSRDMRINPTFHVSLLKCYIAGPLDEQDDPATPPTPLEINGEPAYTVKEILRSRRGRGRLEYLVDWEVYRLEEQCWVPCKDILDPLLKTEIQARNPGQPAPHPRGRSCRSAPRGSSSWGLS